MVRNLFVVLSLAMLTACAIPTSPSQRTVLTITPGSVVMPVNSQFCFLAAGGAQPYTWSIRWTDTTGITTASNQTNCVSSTGSGFFTLTVLSADGQTASANGKVGGN